ncbi:DUF4367 domain-containing protein [Paenibacillus sp. PL91]|uniref:DUF4367 domain-containing protein n=1 Tax=Paenibacillus sp. PL91 TaxID=2729538 RepID=UPI00145FB8A6|nr:DUF4367 domain-containing protein [Paenibacillus sp. PL91]MBC9203735.1 DUF4367 domain-containing protein [Paenibacillus sp. PL91]
MKKENFDHLFDIAFEEASKHHAVIPDPDPSWGKIELQLRRQVKRRTRYKIIPYIAASFILGAIVFGSPTVTKAFNPFFQTVKTIQSNVVTFIFGSNDNSSHNAKTAPPGQDERPDGQDIINGGLTEKQYLTWEEASHDLEFSPHVLKFVPPGFTLTDIRLFFLSGKEKAFKVISFFSDSSTKSFIVSIRILSSNETITSGSDVDAGQYETISLFDTDAYLFSTHDGRTSLDFIKGNLYFSISGSLSKEEIIKVAKNIK